MVTPAGGDARVRVEVEADATAAAADIEDRFAKAAAQAFNSPEVRAAVDKLTDAITDSLSSVGQGGGRGRGGRNGAWDPIVKQAEHAAEQVAEAWEKTAQAAREAGEAAGTPKQAEAGLRTLNSVIEDLAKSMGRFENDAKLAMRAVEEMGKSTRVAGEIAAREQRNASQEAQQSERLRITQIQATTARALQASRARMEILRQLGRQAVIVERAIGQAVVAGARVASGAFRGMVSIASASFRTIASGFRRIFERRGGRDEVSRMMREQTTTISREMRRQEQVVDQSGNRRTGIIRRIFSRQNAEVRSSLNQQTNLYRRAAAEQVATIERVNAARNQGVLGLLSGRSAAASALGIGGLFAGGMGARNIIGGGIGRLLDVEDATVQLQRMGLELAQVNQLLADVDSTFSGTPFSNPDGFNVSTQLFASNVELEKIPGILGTIADFAAHGNVDLLEMSDVFTRIASQGKVTGEELNRLSDRNIPLTVLADALGVTVEKMKEMVAASELSADEFFEAAQSIEMFEGAAKAAGDTTRGAWTNTMTALKRVAENFFRPFFGENGTAVQALKRLQEGIKAIIPTVSAMGEAFAKALPQIMQVAKVLLGLVAIKGTLEILRVLSIGLRTLFFGGRNAQGGRTFGGPIVLFITTMALLMPRLMSASERLREAWAGLREELGGLAEALGRLFGALTGAIGGLISAATQGDGVLRTIGDAIARVIEIISGGIGVVTQWVNLIADALGAGGAGQTGGAAGAGRWSSNNPFANLAEGIQSSEVADVLSSGQFADSILIPISELPEEAQKVFAEEFADVQWVSPHDAARIWEQFSPDAEQLADGMTPSPSVMERARREILKRMADLLGLDDTEFSDAMTRGGNRALNILEETWLGPVIRFLRAAPGRIAEAGSAVWRALRTAFDAVTSAISRFLNFTGLSGVPGFFRDVWDAIFGDPESMTIGAAGRNRGLSVITGGAESIGTRVLNVLEDTFLGPIIRFFRGPVADIVEEHVIPTVGKIIDFFRRDFVPLASRALGAVRDFFIGVGRALRTAWDIVSPFIQPLIDGFKQVFSSFDSAKGVIAGGGIGAVLGGLFGGLPGALAGGLAGAGLGAMLSEPVRTGITDSLGNIGGLVRDKLDEAWDSISGWFSENFTVEKFAGFANSVLGFVHRMGEIIGGIATDPYVVAGVAAAAVGLGFAAAALAAAFLSGFATAMAMNVAQVGAYITDLIDRGWRWAMDRLSLDNTPIARAISGALESTAVEFLVGGAALALGAGVLAAIGRGITSAAGGAQEGRGPISTAAKALGNSLSLALRGTVRGLGGLIGMAFGTKSGGDLKDSSRIGENQFFKTRGEKWGAAIMAGLAIGIAGYMSGQSGSSGNIIMSILAGGATGAGLGAMIGGVPGAAIGAGLGTALAGVTALIGASGAAAKKAADEIEEYASAIRGLRDPLEIAEAVVGVFMENLKDEDQGLREFLAGSGWDIQGFVDRIIAGTSTISDEMSRLLDSVAAADLTWMQEAFDNLDPSVLAGWRDWGVDIDNLNPTLDNFRQQLEYISDLIRAEGITDSSTLVGRISQLANEGAIAPEFAAMMEGMIAVLQDAGFSFEEFADLVGDESGEIAEAIRKAEIDRALADLAAGVDPAKVAFEGMADALAGLDEVGRAEFAQIAAVNLGSLEDAAQGVADAFANGRTAEEINAVLSQSNLTSEERIKALTDAAGILEEAARDARNEMAGLVGEAVAGMDTDAIRRQFRLDLPDVQEQIARALNIDTSEGAEVVIDVALRTSDEFQQVVADWRQGVASQIGDAIDAGLITTEADMSGFIEQLREDIANSGLSDDVQAELNAQLDDIEAVLGGLDWSQLSADAAAAGAAAREALLAGLNGPSFGFGGVWGGGGLELGGILDAAAGAFGIGESNPLQDAIDGMASNIDWAAAENIGSMLPDKVKAGTDANAGVIGDGLGGAMEGALNAGLFASGIFTGVGTGIANQTAAGIRAGTGAVVSGAARLVSGAAVGASYAIGQMVSVGYNMGLGLLRGLTSMAGAVANAARAMALNAARVARNALEVKSPSRVFIDIGRQVGLGFAEGIKEEEATVVGAITGAIDKAMAAAEEKIGKAVASSKAGAAIWEALIPPGGPVPGGLSAVDLNRMLMDVRIGSGSGFRASMIEGAFSQTQARAQTHLAGIELNRASAEMRNAFAETERAVRDVWKAVADGQALTREQQELRSSSWLSLSAGTITGAMNQRALAEALEKVRAWGQAVVEQGGAINTTTASMEKWVTQIRAQAIAAGFNAAAVDGVIKAVGMSTTQLRAMRDEMTSLNAMSTAGIENIREITTQLQAIREYGTALIESGASASAVAAQMKGLRDQFLRQATAFGFNGAQLAALVEQAGLSDSALANFIKQMADFERQAKEAAKAAGELGTDPDMMRRPAVEQIHVHLPYGDPEAAALAVSNRLAFERL